MVTGLAAVLGVALLITDGYLAKLSGSGQSFIGVLMALGCAFAVASYAVLVKPVIGRYGALRITASSAPGTNPMSSMRRWCLPSP